MAMDPRAPSAAEHRAAESLEALRTAAEADPQNVDAQVQLASALIEAAENLVVEPVSATPLIQRIKNQLLGSTPKEGRKAVRDAYLAEALQRLRRASELNPQHGPAHFHRAAVCYELGRTEEMIVAARRAVMAEPFNRYFKEFLVAAEDIYTTRAGRSAHPRELSWDDLVLDEKTKKELEIIVQLLRDPALSRSLGIDPPTGVLLCGPPGTGKTTIARVMAATSQCQFIAADAAKINSMWVGQSESNVRALFRKARRGAPSIVFIDELDALLPVRGLDVGHHTDLVTNQFLQEMDGLVLNDRVFVVGATNRPELVDPAMLRGGRLSRRIEIPLPDRAGRKELLKLKTLVAKLAPDVDFDFLADATAGMSGGDIKALVSEAGVQALLRRRAEGTDGLEITLSDFRGALHNLRPEWAEPAENPDGAPHFWMRLWMRVRRLLGWAARDLNDSRAPRVIRPPETIAEPIRPSGPYRVRKSL